MDIVKKEMPKIKHNIDSLTNLGYDITTFAVATEFDKEEWKKFIKDQKTEDWINVADINHDEEGNPVASSDWRDKYDIYSTPVVYLLDKNKKILAKKNFPLTACRNHIIFWRISEIKKEEINFYNITFVDPESELK